MRSIHSMVISMRLPAESGKRLKRMANRHGWTPSDASARLVEEGLRNEPTKRLILEYLHFLTHLP
jgi:predicted DNA-binding protein